MLQRRSSLVVRNLANEAQLFFFTCYWLCHRFARDYRQHFECPDLDQEQPIYRHTSDDVFPIEFVFQGWRHRRGRCWWHCRGGLDRSRRGMDDRPPPPNSLGAICRGYR